MNKFLTGVAVLSLAFSACKKEPSNNENATAENKLAPKHFSFNTTKEVNLNIRLLSPDNKPLAGVPVNIYSAANTENYIFKAVTDASGSIKAKASIPSYSDTLIVDPQYVGLLSQVKAYVSGGSLNCTIGGQNGFSGNVIAESAFVPQSKNVKESFTVQSAKGPVYVYDSPYDESGKPRNLEPRDIVSPEMLQYINYSLPERQNVGIHHPSYIAESAASVLNIVQTSDVWLTFVHEGATYLNTFGYYTYKTNNPPQSVSDIDTIHYVFPNSSAAGSGGGLFTGDKVKLGRFEAGTSIGFVLFSNSWNGNKVKNNVTKFYSNSNLNPETDPQLRRHTVILHNASENIFLIGFEDKPREDPSCDHDFNDVVFYAKSNPVTGISTENTTPMDTPNDKDGDGVTDPFDEFPNDPARAFTNYFPGKSGWGTLAFEDQWPDKGDYDLNDLVINYRYAFISNAQNKVVEMEGSYYVTAAGASLENGFGVEFPFSPSLVKHVSGQRFIKSYIKRTANGLEAGQGKAVIIPFDHSKAAITNPHGLFVNTDESQQKVYGDTVTVHLDFNTPITAETLGTAPFNPFLISGRGRGFEVHLPGGTPTKLADTKLFGVSYDGTNPKENIYYVSKENWPWAIHFMEPFSYPVETKGIHEAYPHFLDWARSGGKLYPDWYTNTAAGYRVTQNIYSK